MRHREFGIPIRNHLYFLNIIYVSGEDGVAHIKQGLSHRPYNLPCMYGQDGSTIKLKLLPKRYSQKTNEKYCLDF